MTDSPLLNLMVEIAKKEIRTKLQEIIKTQMIPGKKYSPGEIENIVNKKN
jgi:hypothetical protein